MSLGLGRRREEVVPRGEVSTRARAPRGTYFRLTRHCTCSRYLTCAHGKVLEVLNPRFYVPSNCGILALFLQALCSNPPC